MRALLSIFSLSVLLASCLMPPVPTPKDNDNNGGNQNQPSIYAGEWTYTNVAFDNGSLESQGQAFGTFTGEGLELKGGLTITENPNRFTSTLAYTAQITFTIFGFQQSIPIPMEETKIEGSWTEQNGKIVFNADDGTEMPVVISNASTIQFTGAFEELINVGQFGLSATADLTYTLEKN